MSERSILFPADAGPPVRAARPARRKWLWLMLWEIPLLILSIEALRYRTVLQSWKPRSRAEPISLAVYEQAGHLRVEWNRAAKPVIHAAQANLKIVDGVESQSIALTPAMLAAGSYSYIRETADVKVTMTVTDASGEQIYGLSRFLGRPADAETNSAELADVRKRRDDLEAEVRRMRATNDLQAARIQALRRMLRILQARLGIDASN